MCEQYNSPHAIDTYLISARTACYRFSWIKTDATHHLRRIAKPFVRVIKLRSEMDCARAGGGTARRGSQAREDSKSATSGRTARARSSASCGRACKPTGCRARTAIVIAADLQNLPGSAVVADHCDKPPSFRLLAVIDCVVLRL